MSIFLCIPVMDRDQNEFSEHCIEVTQQLKDKCGIEYGQYTWGTKGWTIDEYRLDALYDMGYLLERLSQGDSVVFSSDYASAKECVLIKDICTLFGVPTRVLDAPTQTNK